MHSLYFYRVVVGGDTLRVLIQTKIDERGRLQRAVVKTHLRYRVAQRSVKIHARRYLLREKAFLVIAARSKLMTDLTVMHLLRFAWILGTS